MTSISKINSLVEIAFYWDTHSQDDFWDQTREVKFEVRAKRRRRVPIDPDLYARIEDSDRVRGVLPETLVSLWLSVRLKETMWGIFGSYTVMRGALYYQLL